MVKHHPRLPWSSAAHLARVHRLTRAQLDLMERRDATTDSLTVKLLLAEGIVGSSPAPRIGSSCRGVSIKSSYMGQLCEVAEMRLV